MVASLAVQPPCFVERPSAECFRVCSALAPAGCVSPLCVCMSLCADQRKCLSQMVCLFVLNYCHMHQPIEIAFCREKEAQPKRNCMKSVFINKKNRTKQIRTKLC